VDLNPVGASSSIAYDTHGGQQVGSAILGGQRAGMWSGSASSWTDLHAFLSSEFDTSEAYGIWHDGASTYVAGKARRVSTGGHEAILWVGPAPQTIAATSITVAPGIAINGTPANVNASDDVYYTLRPGVVLTTNQSPIVVTASYNLPAATARAINAVVEARAHQGNIRQTIEAYDFSTSTYSQLNQQVLRTSSDTVMTLPVGPPVDYIGAGNEVRIRVAYKAVGALLIYPWLLSIDEATLRLVP
jgi:hypothetical protein